MIPLRSGGVESPPYALACRDALGMGTPERDGAAGLTARSVNPGGCYQPDGRAATDGRAPDEDPMAPAILDRQPGSIAKVR